MKQLKSSVTILFLVLVLLLTSAFCFFSCDEDDDTNNSAEAPVDSTLNYQNPDYPTLPTNGDGAIILPDIEL